MNFKKIRKNLVPLCCNACKNVKYVYKYSKTKISCDFCTSLLALSTAHKLNFIARVVYKDSLEEEGSDLPLKEEQT